MAKHAIFQKMSVLEEERKGDRNCYPLPYKPVGRSVISMVQYQAEASTSTIGRLRN